MGFKVWYAEYTHQEKTCMNISTLKLFRRHRINRSYLWPLRLQEVLKVVAIGFQALMSMVNDCLGKVYFLNTC